MILHSHFPSYFSGLGTGLVSRKSGIQIPAQAGEFKFVKNYLRQLQFDKKN